MKQMRYGIVGGAAVLGVVSLALPAFAQRAYDPNLKNFYMARQQIQILDDQPAINDLRTVPGAPGQGGAPGVQGPQALPRAGFQPYSSPALLNGSTRNLPPAQSGPRNLPPALGGGVVGQKATAQKLKPAKSAPASSGTQTAKSYAPYKKYATPVTSPGSSSGSMLNTSTNVSGSVLHWNKRRKGF